MAIDDIINTVCFLKQMENMVECYYHSHTGWVTVFRNLHGKFKILNLVARHIAHPTHMGGSEAIHSFFNKHISTLAQTKIVEVKTGP